MKQYIYQNQKSSKIYPIKPFWKNPIDTVVFQEIMQPVDLGGSVLSHYLQALIHPRWWSSTPRCSFPEPSASNIRKADSETDEGRSCENPRHDRGMVKMMVETMVETATIIGNCYINK